jgi:hypothetical protein
MTEKKSMIDSLFDAAERVVDGAAGVLSGVPEPEEELEKAKPESQVQPRYGKVIDVPSESQPLLKSDAKQEVKKPREVVLGVKNVSSRRRGGVNIVAETPTHELVCIVLSEEDWKKVCDAADWMRMVSE